VRTEERHDTISLHLLPCLLDPADGASTEPLRDHWSFESFQNVRLIVAELVSNCARHGPPGGPVGLSVRADASRLRGEVTDQGAGFVAPSREAMDASNAHGLLVVDALADRWGVMEGAPTYVWFEIDRRPDGDPRASRG
jgi:two-component sensor histidine kinase